MALIAFLESLVGNSGKQTKISNHFCSNKLYISSSVLSLLEAFLLGNSTPVPGTGDRTI